MGLQVDWTTISRVFFLFVCLFVLVFCLVWRVYALIHLPSLNQLLACRLVSAKSLSQTILENCQLALRNRLQWNINRSTNIFIQENAFEIVVCRHFYCCYMPCICICISLSFRLGLNMLMFYGDRQVWGCLTHLPLDKMAAILQTIFSDAISRMKWFLFGLRPKGPIGNHAALVYIMVWRHYLNQ